MNNREPILEDEFRVRSWADWEVVEHPELGGLFLDKIWKRNLVTGEWEFQLVRFLIPQPKEFRALRVQAREVAKAEKLNPDLDPLEFENLDAAVILQRALRDPTEPYGPWALDLPDLERRLTKEQLRQAWKRLAYFRRLLDPEVSDISGEQMVALSSMIVRERSIRPLGVFDSDSQARYVIFLAEQHVIPQTERSSEDSSGPSTPES